MHLRMFASHRCGLRPLLGAHRSRVLSTGNLQIYWHCPCRNNDVPSDQRLFTTFTVVEVAKRARPWNAAMPAFANLFSRRFGTASVKERLKRINSDQSI
jgi:hypothetical protein